MKPSKRLKTFGLGSTLLLPFLPVLSLAGAPVFNAAPQDTAVPVAESTQQAWVQRSPEVQPEIATTDEPEPQGQAAGQILLRMQRMQQELAELRAKVAAQEYALQKVQEQQRVSYAILINV